MKEDTQVRQIPGEPSRRWFSSADFDLIVWVDDDANLTGFELCYDKQTEERSISWHPDRGFQHRGVDDGEQRPGKPKASPVHVSVGTFDAGRVERDFTVASQSIPPEVAEYVCAKLRHF